MKVKSLALVAVFLFTAQTAAAQTAEEVIEKSLNAMGGRAALEKIKTRVVTGNLSIGTPAGDIAGTVEMYAAAPNKQRTVIKADLSAFGAGPAADRSALRRHHRLRDGQHAGQPRHHGQPAR